MKIEYLIPNPWSSSSGRQGTLAHLNLDCHKDGWNFVEYTGMYASHCKPYAWGATGWLKSDNLDGYKLCKRCAKILERMVEE